MSESGSSKAKEMVLMVAVLILAIYLVPTVVTAVTGSNQTDAFWNFTGGTGARAIFNLIPFIFVIGILIWLIVSAVKG